MDKTILEQLADELQIKQPKVKKAKTPRIVCNIDGELKSFKDEDKLKQFMFKERVDTVIRYDLVGQVIFPIQLETKPIK